MVYTTVYTNSKLSS